MTQMTLTLDTRDALIAAWYMRTSTTNTRVLEIADRITEAATVHEQRAAAHALWCESFLAAERQRLGDGAV